VRCRSKTHGYRIIRPAESAFRNGVAACAVSDAGHNDRKRHIRVTVGTSVLELSGRTDVALQLVPAGKRLPHG